MNFVTYSDLNNDIVHYLSVLPRDVDIVVGIPRSGLLVANLIALYINKPVVDIDTFCRGEIPSVGDTKSRVGVIDDFSKIRTALIVEDCVGQGRSIAKAKEKLQKLPYDITYTFFAPYIANGKQELVDYYIKIMNGSWIFEWNYIHALLIKNACFDIDGVLCADPTKAEDDDGEKYKNFLVNAKPLLIPTQKVGLIVTCRLEKYRGLTEEWLKKHHIEYGELIMMPYENIEERSKHGDYAEFKAKVYKNHKDTSLFIESSVKQAVEINRITGKPVFCIDNQTYYKKGKIEEVKTAARNRMKGCIKRFLPPVLIRLLRKVRSKSLMLISHKK